MHFEDVLRFSDLLFIFFLKHSTLNVLKVHKTKNLFLNFLSRKHQQFTQRVVSRLLKFVNKFSRFPYKQQLSPRVSNQLNTNFQQI